MRRFAALAGTIAAAALAGVAPPHAAAASGLGMSLHVSGTVVATWHGDPSRGCEKAGVCDMRGSATYRPGFAGRLEVSRDSVSFGGADSAQPTVVRVRDGGGPETVACADVLDAGFDPLGFDYLSDELQVTLEELDLSAGRCGGPRTVDLAHALPHGKIKTRLLRASPRALDLSAHGRFVAGPFSGRLISTVQIAFGRARASAGGFSPRVLRVPSRGRSTRRYWVLDVRYRLRGVSGEIATDFRGLPEPACLPLGACGARGTSSLALRGVTGRVDLLVGRRLRRGRRRPSAEAALRLLRRGTLPVYGDSRIWHARATVTQNVTTPAGSCSDSLFAEPPTLESRSTRRGVVLLVRSGELGSLGDTVRTRCPGPSQADVLEQGALAYGTIPRRQVGAPAIALTVASARSFSKNGYAGTRHGRLGVDLALERSRVFVVRG